MSFLIRVAESRYGYPTISAIIIRSFTSIFLSLAYLTFHKLFHKLLLSRLHLTLLSLRGLFGAATGVCTFFSLNYLPVGIAITILYASPAITSVLAAIFLGDAFTPSHILTLVLNFTGVTLTSHGSYAARDAAPDGILLGVSYAMLAALAASIVFILVRAMGLRVHFVLGCLFYGVGCAVMALLLGSRADLIAIRDNANGTVFALLSGLAGFGSQALLTRSLQLVPPGPAAVVRSLNVPLSFVLGLVFLAERPSVVSTLGVALVLASIASVAWQKRRVAQVQSAPQGRADVTRYESSS